MQFRNWANCAVGIVSTLALSAMRALPAEPWPHRPVRIMVPTAAGSSPDIAARVFAERLGASWGQPVVVDNRPGADGLVGTAAFAAARDDHVLLVSFAAPITVYPVLQDKLSYDPVRDVIPVSALAETFGAISVPSLLPVATLSDLVGYTRSRPGQLNWTTGGGAFPILFAGFVEAAGLDMTQVPYRDQNLAVQDVAEGRLQVIATPMTAVLPLVHARKIRVVVVTNHRRSPFWPDIPTSRESGYPDLAFEGLIGVFAPRGTPDDRREKMSADIRAIAVEPSVAQRLGATGQVVRGNTPAEFATAIEEQRAQIAAIVRRTGKPGP